jgi:hypothetical protein
LQAGRTIAQVVSSWPGSGRVGFVANEVELGKVSSEYLDFPCQSSHRLFHAHHHPSSGVGTIGQIVADVPVLPHAMNQKINRFASTYIALLVNCTVARIQRK